MTGVLGVFFAAFLRLEFRPLENPAKLSQRLVVAQGGHKQIRLLQGVVELHVTGSDILHLQLLSLLEDREELLLRMCLCHIQTLHHAHLALGQHGGFKGYGQGNRV